ncbi:MAG: bifunctional (p)ppGpp synthetase/guanosine-3',5'-bis(diphosphate) 3'-pyrophosphohydrolase [Alphaproteobacteria bacterium]|nr:bifunctional (p)ppGpp synthetase/guanosine-3',5'-bis(diphosphate) 3'-pyrophosphohydrolase [Alphaproteobacteria bacterium]
MRQYELVERVKAYDPNADEDLLNRAYVFSMQAHGAQMRASGDLYFSHPLQVAGILTEMKMDSTTIATALLHDTVEDTHVTLEDIEKHFGRDVAKLVDGVTKLSRIQLQSDQATKQAENFRKLVLAMSADIRVLLVKLADRLHNMRTIHFIPKPEKRMRIARETLDIYATLAERIGIQKMQDELQDLAFAVLNPDARDSILARLTYLRTEGGSLAEKIRQTLEDVLKEEGVVATVEGREKRPYSIWRKMTRKDIGFEQLSDIMAFRILVNSVGSCYQALGVIHNRYSGIPGRFKDYISIPKPNKYQSIHTTIIGPERQRIEVQIRTHEMHEIAELGVAAHWAYKQSAQSSGTEYRWLRELLDIVEHASKPEEFLEHTKLELFQDQVFCFSPKGDIITLPRGATPVDFAYAVHSRVGDACVGSKVNGRMVPLRTELHNGDQVEIITSKSGTPSPAWERFVVTGKARARIRRFVRIQQRTEYVALGKAILEKLCKQENIDFGEKPFEAIFKNYQAATLEDLFANIGASLISSRDVFYAAYPDAKAKQPEKTMPEIEVAAKKMKDRVATQSSPLTLKGLIPGMAMHFARCCHPLPGDEIVGIVSTGRGVTIHTKDCETLDSFRDMPERWIDVEWGEGHGKENAGLVGRLTIVVTNQPNSLGALTTIIGKGNANILNLKIINRSLDFFDILVDVEVKDTKHLMNVIAALRSNSAIISVDRAKSR